MKRVAVSLLLIPLSLLADTLWIGGDKSYFFSESGEFRYIKHPPSNVKVLNKLERQACEDARELGGEVSFFCGLGQSETDTRYKGVYKLEDKLCGNKHSAGSLSEGNLMLYYQNYRCCLKREIIEGRMLLTRLWSKPEDVKGYSFCENVVLDSYSIQK